MLGVIFVLLCKVCSNGNLQGLPQQRSEVTGACRQAAAGCSCFPEEGPGLEGDSSPALGD